MSTILDELKSGVMFRKNSISISSPTKPQNDVISKYFPKIPARSDPPSPVLPYEKNIMSQLSNESSSESTDWAAAALLTDSSESVTSFKSASCQFDSPYRDLMSEIKPGSQQKQSTDDSLLSDETCDFKACSATSALKKSKILQLKSEKNPRKVTKPERKCKKLLGKNKIPYVYKAIEESFKNNYAGDDVNPEHLQMALALSKSSYEAENGRILSGNDNSESSNLEDSDTTFAYQERRDSKKSAEFKKAFERFGFRYQKNSDRSSRNAVESSRQSKVVRKCLKKSKYCYITPILKLRTEEERQALITSKVSLILGQNHNRLTAEGNNAIDIDENQEKSDLLHSEVLQSILAESSQKIFLLNSKDLSELGCGNGKLFYVSGLGISPAEKSCCGCLLKDWARIPGRDWSPVRNARDSTVIRAQVSERNSEIDEDSEISGDCENSEKYGCDIVKTPSTTPSTDQTENNARKIDESPKFDQNRAKYSPKIDKKAKKIIRCTSPDLFASSDEETTESIPTGAPPIADFVFNMAQSSEEECENPTSDVSKKSNLDSGNANFTTSARFCNVKQALDDGNEENSKTPTSDVSRKTNYTSNDANYTTSALFCKINECFANGNGENAKHPTSDVTGNSDSVTRSSFNMAQQDTPSLYLSKGNCTSSENPTSDVTQFPNGIAQTPENEFLLRTVVQVDGTSHIPKATQSTSTHSKYPTSDVTRLQISDHEDTFNLEQNYDQSNVRKLSDSKKIPLISDSHVQMIVDCCDLTQSSENGSLSPEISKFRESQQTSQSVRDFENPTSDVSKFRESQQTSQSVRDSENPTSDVSDISTSARNKSNCEEDFTNFEGHSVLEGHDGSFGVTTNGTPTSDVGKNSIPTEIRQSPVDFYRQCATEPHDESISSANLNENPTSDVTGNVSFSTGNTSSERNFEKFGRKISTKSCANVNPTSDAQSTICSVANTPNISRRFEIFHEKSSTESRANFNPTSDVRSSICSVATTPNTSKYSDLNVTDYVNRMLNADPDLEKFGPAGTSHDLDDLGVDFLDSDTHSLNWEKLSQESSLSQEEEGILISDDELNYSCNITSNKRYELSDSDEDVIMRQSAEIKSKVGRNTSDCLDDSFGRLLGDSAVLEKLENFNKGSGAQFKASNAQFSKEIRGKTTQEEPNSDVLCQKTDSEIGAQRGAPTNSEIPTTVDIDTPQKQSKIDTCQKETPDNNLLIIKTKNVTPMADYDQMNTPVIAKELNKFGLKPLKRQRGAKLLKYIYESTHPLIDGAHQQKEFYEDQDGDDQKVTKKRKLLAVPKNNGDVNVKAPSTVVAGNWQAVDIVGDLISDSDLETGLIFERKSSKKISTCQVPLQIVWHNFVSCNPQIKENILLYEPLQLEVVHAMLKEQGFKFNVQDLLTFLDKKCITVRTGNQSQGGHRTRRKK